MVENEISNNENEQFDATAMQAKLAKAVSGWQQEGLTSDEIRERTATEFLAGPLAQVTEAGQKNGATAEQIRRDQAAVFIPALDILANARDRSFTTQQQSQGNGALGRGLFSTGAEIFNRTIGRTGIARISDQPGILFELFPVMPVSKPEQNGNGKNGKKI